jgi:hypothetical protein
MKYKNIADLDSKIEKIVKKTVKHYYTDWKNYDRPKYMGFKGSSDRHDKDLILIARECGTYLIRTEDARTAGTWADTLYKYFQTQEHASYYRINLDSLTLETLQPTERKKEIA